MAEVGGKTADVISSPVVGVKEGVKIMGCADLMRASPIPLLLNWGDAAMDIIMPIPLCYRSHVSQDTPSIFGNVFSLSCTYSPTQDELFPVEAQ